MQNLRLPAVYSIARGYLPVVTGNRNGRTGFRLTPYRREIGAQAAMIVPGEGLQILGAEVPVPSLYHVEYMEQDIMTVVDDLFHVTCLGG